MLVWCSNKLPWIVSYNAEDLQCRAGSADPWKKEPFSWPTDSVHGIDCMCTNAESCPYWEAKMMRVRFLKREWLSVIGRNQNYRKHLWVRDGIQDGLGYTRKPPAWVSLCASSSWLPSPSTFFSPRYALSLFPTSCLFSHSRYLASAPFWGTVDEELLSVHVTYTSHTYAYVVCTYNRIIYISWVYGVKLPISSF